jgi:hypothetical protein
VLESLLDREPAAVRIKRELNIAEVDRIKGETSRELADRCPDRLVVFPSSPCTNIGCKYAIQQPGYMNCTFVAAETGEHTLEAIGEMMGITREGVRLIEARALAKLRAGLEKQQQSDNETDETTRHKSRVAAGGGDIYPIGQGDQLTNEGDLFPAVVGGELGKCFG